MNAQPALDDAGSAATTRILVVEDEWIVARDLQAKLLGLGYDVPELAVSGEEALVLAEATRPDLVLMDISLRTEMDGIEAARILRKRDNVPVVYLTAYSDRELMERAFATGAFGYVLKPFERQNLRAVIELALHRHFLDRHNAQQRRLLGSILETFPGGLIAADLAGRVIYVNREAERLADATAPEILGTPLRQILRRADGSLLAAGGADESLQGVEAELVVRAYRRLPIELTVVPLRDRSGAPIGRACTFRPLESPDA